MIMPNESCPQCYMKSQKKNWYSGSFCCLLPFAVLLQLLDIDSSGQTVLPPSSFNSLTKHNVVLPVTVLK